MQYSIDSEIKLKIKYLKHQNWPCRILKAQNDNTFWNFPLDQISNASNVMLYLVAEGWGKGENVEMSQLKIMPIVSWFIRLPPYHSMG